MEKKKEILLVAIFLIIQTIIYVFTGLQKSYIHIDEAYSFGLANYDKVEIEENDDFFNKWHTKNYFTDYLTIQDDEINDYIPVYENQKNDVHPPFYYLLLRLAMNFAGNHFSIWTGIVLNIIIYLFITIFTYLILKRLLIHEKNFQIKAIVLAFCSSIILSSLSNVIYIRMYCLLTLEILITIFLHIKLLEERNINPKLLISIGIIVLLGTLTHYYYLWYIIVLYIIFFIKYIRTKQTKQLLYYTLTLIIAGTVSLIIFPYMIQHIFYGYRGQEAIDNLKNTSGIWDGILSQIKNVNYYVFSDLMYLILTIILVGFVFLVFKKKIPKMKKEEFNIIEIILIPSIFFFLITSVASPWKVLRYFVPICGLIFIVAMYFIYKMLQAIYKEKVCNIIMFCLLITILIMPMITNMKPELLYEDRKEIVARIEEKTDLLALYVYDSKTAGFLNDILLFTKINESYITEDIDVTEENIKEIFIDKNVNDGIILFISNGQNNDEIINIVKKALGLKDSEFIQQLWCSTVYFVY